MKRKEIKTFEGAMQDMQNATIKDHDLIKSLRRGGKSLESCWAQIIDKPRLEFEIKQVKHGDILVELWKMLLPVKHLFETQFTRNEIISSAIKPSDTNPMTQLKNIVYDVRQLRDLVEKDSGRKKITLFEPLLVPAFTRVWTEINSKDYKTSSSVLYYLFQFIALVGTEFWYVRDEFKKIHDMMADAYKYRFAEKTEFGEVRRLLRTEYYELEIVKEHREQKINELTHMFYNDLEDTTEFHHTTQQNRNSIARRYAEERYTSIAPNIEILSRFDYPPEDWIPSFGFESMQVGRSRETNDSYLEITVEPKEEIGTRLFDRPANSAGTEQLQWRNKNDETKESN